MMFCVFCNKEMNENYYDWQYYCTICDHGMDDNQDVAFNYLDYRVFTTTEDTEIFNRKSKEVIILPSIEWDLSDLENLTKQLKLIITFA